MPVLTLQEKAAFDALIAAGLPERIAALEGRVTAPGAPSPLRKLNAGRAADAERLRAQIGEVLRAHRGPKQLKAKGVVQALRQRGIECRVSMRTVQDHMHAIRSESAQQSVAGLVHTPHECGTDPC